MNKDEYLLLVAAVGDLVDDIDHQFVAIPEGIDYVPIGQHLIFPQFTCEVVSNKSGQIELVRVRGSLPMNTEGAEKELGHLELPQGTLRVGSLLLTESGDLHTVSRIFLKPSIDHALTRNDKVNPLGHEIYDLTTQVELESEDGSKKTVQATKLEDYILPPRGSGTTIQSMISYFDEKQLADADKLAEDKEQVSQDADSMLPATTNSSLLIRKRNDLVAKKNTAMFHVAMANRKVRDYREEMAVRMESLNLMLSELKEAIKKVSRLVATLEIFSGVSTSVFQIAEGSDASPEEPISIMQSVLYMDEEYGDPSDGGIDINYVGVFDEWVVQPDNLKKLAPTNKCIVAIRPRRFDKVYSDDWYTNCILNMQNNHTYFLFRDGTNVYRAWDSNINVQDYIFPSEKELTELVDLLNSRYRFDKEKGDDGLFKYSKLVLLFQAVINNTEVFSSNRTANLFDINSRESDFNFIYDAGPSLTSSNMPSFPQWLKSLNGKLSKGKRIYLSSSVLHDRLGHRKGNPDRYRVYYSNEWSVPPYPQSGLYVLHSEDGGIGCDYEYSIRYNPNDEIRVPDEWQPRARQVNLSWYISKYDSFVLNYDDLLVEELEFYLNDRYNRRYYASMMPILWGLLKLKKKDEQYKESLCLNVAGMVRSYYRKYHGLGVAPDELVPIVKEELDAYMEQLTWKKSVFDDPNAAIDYMFRMTLLSYKRRCGKPDGPTKLDEVPRIAKIGGWSYVAYGVTKREAIDKIYELCRRRRRRGHPTPTKKQVGDSLIPYLGDLELPGSKGVFDFEG